MGLLILFNPSFRAAGLILKYTMHLHPALCVVHEAWALWGH